MKLVDFGRVRHVPRVFVAVVVVGYWRVLHGFPKINYVKSNISAKRPAVQLARLVLPVRLVRLVRPVRPVRLVAAVVVVDLRVLRGCHYLVGPIRSIELKFFCY